MFILVSFMDLQEKIARNILVADNYKFLLQIEITLGIQLDYNHYTLKNL